LFATETEFLKNIREEGIN